jgi:hypothetical protein
MPDMVWRVLEYVGLFTALVGVAVATSCIVGRVLSDVSFFF